MASIAPRRIATASNAVKIMRSIRAEAAHVATPIAMLLASSGVTYLQGYYFAKPELTRLKGSPVLPLGAEPPQPVEPEDIGGLRFAS